MCRLLFFMECLVWNVKEMYSFKLKNIYTINITLNDLLYYKNYFVYFSVVPNSNDISILN
jgi:hypothetical protein